MVWMAGHKRIGNKFLHPGPGYGGSCFPKDTLALVRTAEDYRSDVSIVEGVVAYNAARKSAGKCFSKTLLSWPRVVIAASDGVDGKTVLPSYPEN